MLILITNTTPKRVAIRLANGKPLSLEVNETVIVSGGDKEEKFFKPLELYGLSVVIKTDFVKIQSTKKSTTVTSDVEEKPVVEDKVAKPTTTDKKSDSSKKRATSKK